MIAGMVLSNLLYVVGAIVAATVVSGFVLLRHRRPKSLEAGIEMFSRELRALQPERHGPATPGAGRVIPNGRSGETELRAAAPVRGSSGRGSTGRGSTGREATGRWAGAGATVRDGAPERPAPHRSAPRGAAVTPLAVAPVPDTPTISSDPGGSDEAQASWPDQENEPG